MTRSPYNRYELAASRAESIGVWPADSAARVARREIIDTVC